MNWSPKKPSACSTPSRFSVRTGSVTWPECEERAATAGLHAKLMPVMQDFIGGVQKAMADQHLDCPLLVVGGNGQAMGAEKAVNEAGLTVASGPACTAHFGAAKSDGDSLVIDVGAPPPISP